MSGAKASPVSAYFAKDGASSEGKEEFSFGFAVEEGGSAKGKRKRGKKKGKKREGDGVEEAASAIADGSYGDYEGLPPAETAATSPGDAAKAAGAAGSSAGSSTTTTMKVGHGAASATPAASTLDKEDGFLPGSQWQEISIGDATSRARRRRWFERMIKGAYGELDMDDLGRIAMLSAMLFFIIGGYWLLRSLKDPVMTHIVGIEYIPKAKMLSLFVVLGAVYVYNILLDMYKGHQLFYIVGGFYICVFGCIAALLAHPTIGMANAEPSPLRFLGWISYFAIESFGSIQVSLFWQFTNANVDLKTAKSAYGLIVAGAQIGSILGPTVATNADAIGMPMLYLCGAACVAAMVAVVYLYVGTYGASKGDQQASSGKKKERANALEGLTLMSRYAYVRGIFAISCLFMVEVTILDYMMKVLANGEFRERYPDDPQAASKAFTAFMGSFGQMTNLVSFGFSLTGTSFVIRSFGLKRTLLAFPSLCCVAIAMVWSLPQLYVVFFAMMLLKAFSYALNNPCKEILYQPTASVVKFKCKSWIDTFGARGSKALGSVITDSFSGSVPLLVGYGSFVAGGCSLFLVWVAHWMGGRFNELVESDEIIGEEMAMETVFGLDDQNDEEEAVLGLAEAKGDVPLKMDEEVVEEVTV